MDIVENNKSTDEVAIETRTDESQKLLEVKNLKTYFYTEEGIVKAVDGVSFDIYEDEVLGLVGETGCGKSVTALSILQLVRAPGKIIDGSVRSKVDQRIMKRVARRGMTWVFGIDGEFLDVWLNQRGFILIDRAGAEDYREKYLDPVGRRLNIYEGERIVLAEIS